MVRKRRRSYLGQTNLTRATKMPDLARSVFMEFWPRQTRGTTKISNDSIPMSRHFRAMQPFGGFIQEGMSEEKIHTLYTPRPIDGIYASFQADWLDRESFRD